MVLSTVELSNFHYNSSLVALSIGIAIFAAYTAFETTECAKTPRSSGLQVLWIVLGGLTLGGGIWAMHFIGMLALQLEIPVRYDFGETIASLLIASIASGFALFQVAQPEFRWPQQVLGATVTGGAIASMHYIGMAAIRAPATMETSSAIVGLSIAIAIAVSGAAQWILRRFESVDRARELWRWCASIVMGLAVASMHYTAMLGVRFVPDPGVAQASFESLDPLRLTELVSVGIFLFCGITLIITLSERRRALQIVLHDLQNAQMRLVQAEKLSSVGQLSAGISHEVNNPLAFLKGNLIYLDATLEELLDLIALADRQRQALPADVAAQLDGLDWEFLREDVPKSVKSMHTGIARIQDIVRSLEVFASCNESELKSIDLCARIDDALKLLAKRFDRNDRPSITIEKSYETIPKLECCSGEVLQSIFSLLENSVEAIERRWKAGDLAAGTIAISTRPLDDRRIHISISDTGQGCDPHRVPKLFEPFFTTKNPGEGTGMGLTLALQTARRHGGTLTLTPTASGMTAEMVLPIRGLAPADANRTDRKAPAKPSTQPQPLAEMTK